MAARTPPPPPVVKPPAPEEMTGDAIRRAILRQSLAHPFTVLPTALAVATLGGAVVGPPLLFAGAAMLLGSIGFGSFAVNYYMRPKTLGDRYLAGLERRRQVASAVGIQEVRRELMVLGSAEGVKQWDELVAAHANFQRGLEKRRTEGVALDVGTLQELADRTLEEGLGHLRAYIASVRALKVIDAGRLRTEAGELKSRIAKLARGGPETDRARSALEAQLAAMDERLGRHAEESNRLNEILAACEKCEAVLETGALNLGTMREVTARFVEDAAQKLKETVDTAQRFNERLSSRPDEERDRIYDRAASEPPPDEEESRPRDDAERGRLPRERE